MRLGRSELAGLTPGQTQFGLKRNKTGRGRWEWWGCAVAALTLRIATRTAAREPPVGVFDKLRAGVRVRAVSARWRLAQPADRVPCLLWRPAARSDWLPSARRSAAGLFGGWSTLNVVFFTNTPQLVQIYFLFFALPEAGILLSSYAAVLIGMTLNAGAYLTEIQRAGFSSVRQTEMEAAETLGMSRWQQVRYVIVPHIARVLFPPLSNHYILMTLGNLDGSDLWRRGTHRSRSERQFGNLPIDRDVLG